MIEMSKLKNHVDHDKPDNISITNIPKYFQPFVDIIDTLGLEHNYSYSLANCLNNIMNVKIQALREDLEQQIENSKFDPRNLDR